MRFSACLLLIASSVSAQAVTDTRHMEKGLLGKILGDEVSYPLRPPGAPGGSPSECLEFKEPMEHEEFSFTCSPCILRSQSIRRSRIVFRHSIHLVKRSCVYRDRSLRPGCRHGTGSETRELMLFILGSILKELGGGAVSVARRVTFDGTEKWFPNSRHML